MPVGSAPTAAAWNTGAIEPDPPLLGVSTVDLAAELAGEDDGHPPRRRSPVLTLVVRVLLSAVMLAVLVWRLPEVRWSDLGPRWRSASAVWLVAAGLTMSAAFALSTLRWRRVLVAMRPAPRYRRMLSHFLAGQFVSNVLPTAFGGDVIRVSRLGRDIGDHPAAFAVRHDRAHDRLAGAPAHQRRGPARAARPVVARLGDGPRRRDRRRHDRRPRRRAPRRVQPTLGASVETVTGWRRFFVAIHLGVDALRRDRRGSLEVIAAGAAFQTLQCLAVWMAAEAIGLQGQVTVGVALAFFPAAAIAQNLPVGLGGLGVREGIFVVFFGAVGAPRALSITLGLVVYGLTIVTSALGAPSFAIGSRTPVRRILTPGMSHRPSAGHRLGS
ncbi:MAG: lysylphosphatidylglycerol synthase transmembrane domain-containing protein [Microthrixaceae bacterium]